MSREGTLNPIWGSQRGQCLHYNMKGEGGRWEAARDMRSKDTRYIQRFTQSFSSQMNRGGKVPEATVERVW